MSNHQSVSYTTANKSMHNKSHSQYKHRTQSQYQRPPLQHQKSNMAFQTPPPHHQISKTSNYSQSTFIDIKQKAQQSQQVLKQMQKLDNEFVKTLTDLQNYYTQLTKHQQIRVEKWIVKIIQNDQTIRWKQNRNNYLKLLYHVVKLNGTLLQPFDKMPDLNKDLPYLSDHQFSQKIKPRFDGKTPNFHIHKPEMVKIDEPRGDNSVLLSIINTARTQMSKQNNNQLNRPVDSNMNNHCNQIKQSQLIQIQPHTIRNQQKANEQRNQYQNQEEIQLPKTTKPIKKQAFKQMEVSSVIPSNLPSQVKSVCNGIKTNNQNNQNNTSFNLKQKTSKFKHYQKYSNNNSFIDSNPMFNKQSLNSSYLQFGNRSSGNSQQLKVYKQLVLAMGKLLLKHQFTIQKQSQYWQLLKMIYSYQSSLNNSLIATPQHPSSYKSGNHSHTDRVVQDVQSFQTFLSRLRLQIEQQNTINTPHSINTPHNNITRNNKTSQALSPHLKYTKQKQSSDNQLSYSDRQSIIQQQHRFMYSQSSNDNKQTRLQKIKSIPIYNQPQTVNHITQESLDFKVQQGAQPSHLLYYQLNQKPKLSIPNSRQSAQQQLYLSEQQKVTSPQQNNNSLMQISDSYRQIRRKNNQDYHNIYNELQAVQDEQICFTKDRLNEDIGTDRMYYKQNNQNIKQNVKQFDQSPQFTDRQSEEEQIYEDQIVNQKEQQERQDNQNEDLTQDQEEENNQQNEYKLL